MDRARIAAVARATNPLPHAVIPPPTAINPRMLWERAQEVVRDPS